MNLDKYVDRQTLLNKVKRRNEKKKKLQGSGNTSGLMRGEMSTEDGGGGSTEYVMRDANKGSILVACG